MKNIFLSFYNFLILPFSIIDFKGQVKQNKKQKKDNKKKNREKELQVKTLKKEKIPKKGSPFICRAVIKTALNKSSRVQYVHPTDRDDLFL